MPAPSAAGLSLPRHAYRGRLNGELFLNLPFFLPSSYPCKNHETLNCNYCFRSNRAGSVRSCLGAVGTSETDCPFFRPRRETVSIVCDGPAGQSARLSRFHAEAKQSGSRRYVQRPFSSDRKGRETIVRILDAGNAGSGHRSAYCVQQKRRRRPDVDPGSRFSRIPE